MRAQFFVFTIAFTLLIGSVYSQTVYITKTGTKYHNKGCRYLSKSSEAISLADAKAKGYTPCSVCKPSSTVNSTPSTKPVSEPDSTKTEKQGNKTTNKTTIQESKSVQCSAITKAGTRCKRMTKSPNGKCYQHGGN